MVSLRSETQFLSSSSSAFGSTLCPLDPLSDVGRAILEFDAIGLPTGEKCNRRLIDERHVFQIQRELLPPILRDEQLSEFLDIIGFYSATESEEDSAVGRLLDFKHANSQCLKRT
jgi:hypothetical protein